MSDPVEHWFDTHTDRVLTRQTSQLETVKLLVTFSLAVSATLVATALQVEPVRNFDHVAAYILGVAFILTIWVIVNDRSITMDSDDARASMQPSWSHDRKLRHLRYLTRQAVTFNEQVVLKSKIWAGIQLAVSLVTSVLAAVSLLQ